MPAAPSLIAPEPGPDTLVEVRWAGRRLGPLRGAPGRAIGESWEFSTLPEHESRALGRPLSAVLGRPLGFLAKLIDTRLPLSIQVHPAADPASHWNGKEEAWVVLDAEPGAEVLLGVCSGIDAAELAKRARAAVAGGDPRPLEQALRRVPVRRGSALLVPTGTLHSIGAGILLAEIQQPADRTYRLYDWGSARELQVEAALAAVQTASAAQIWQPDEPPRRLRGRCVELEILGPGTHRIQAGSEALLVPVAGDCELRAGEIREQPAPGELRLFTGPSLSIRVGAASLLVVGKVAAV
jgi:mannose-6-phosphate isomerase class I